MKSHFKEGIEHFVIIIFNKGRVWLWTWSVANEHTPANPSLYSMTMYDEDLQNGPNILFNMDQKSEWPRPYTQQESVCEVKSSILCKSKLSPPGGDYK